MADLSPLFDQAGRQYNVDPRLLATIFQVESGSNPNSQDGPLSPYGGGERAQGGMQMLPATATAMGAKNPRDITQAIPAAARYLAEGLDKTGTVAGAAMYYHGGPDTRIWGPKTQAYAAKVQALYGQGAAPSAPSAQPATAAPQDDPDVARGAALLSAQPAATATAAPADDPDVARGAAVLESATKAQPAPETPAQPNAAPAAAPAPDASQQPVLAQVAAGAQHGFVHDVAGTLARGVANAGQWVDDRVPALAALDQAAGINNAAVGPRLDAMQQSYDQQYGNSTPAAIGRLGGQMLATVPVGGVANGLAGAAGNAVLGSAGRAMMTGTMGTGLMRAPSLAVQGAVLGGATAAATGDNPLLGAATGAVAGPVLTGAGKVIGTGVDRLLGRGASAVSPEVAQLADLAQNKYGIPLRADQLSSSGAVRMAGDVVNRLPMTGGSEFTAQQLTAYNRAVAKTIGENADALTPAVMSTAKQRIGAMFDHVENNISVPVATDQTFLGRLGQIEADAKSAMPGDSAQAISNQVTDILDKAVAGNGALAGDSYRGFVKTGTPLDRLTNSNDSNIKFYAGQIKSALQDALDRSLPPGSPIQQEYQTARQQYRNLKTIETLVAKAPTGNVSPALMMGRALANDPQMAYTGGGDLGDLARIGQQFLKAPANSGTPERSAILNGLLAAGRGAAALAGPGAAYYLTNDLPTAAITLGGGAVASQVANGMLRDPARVNRLIQGGLAVRKPAVFNPMVDQLQPYLAPAAAVVEQRPTSK